MYMAMAGFGKEPAEGSSMMIGKSLSLSIEI